MSTNEYNEINGIISSDELYKEITETQNHPEYHTTVINVLPPQYFADCHIKDSINIEAHLIADYVEDWDRAKFIVIYSASDDLSVSQHAYKRLIAMGFKYVRILSDGMNGWLSNGYPTDGACKMDYLHS
ncbi:MAG: rhodanese-like domain-containing protein [bacterium]